MTFPANAYCLAFAAGLVTSLASLPLWRRWCRRIGLVDDPGHRKIHHTPIPLAGGLAVLTALLLPLVFGALFLSVPIFSGEQWLGARSADLLTYGLGKRRIQLLAILLGAIGMALLGWLDDKHELSPTLKFAGQLLIAFFTAAAGVRITLFIPSLTFSFIVTMLWILTLTNAFNFMDNMNGLCSGLAAISAAFFAVSAMRHGQYLVASIALLICGAVMGFLPYNFPKASAFLGDTGSHLLGYLMAILAILPHFYSSKNPQTLAVFSPLLILAVPLIDLVWVVIIRWRLRKPFYVGDTNHLSHRLVRRGLGKAQAVMLIWTLAALFASLTLWF